MEREDYVTTFVTDLVSCNQERIKECIQLPVTVDDSLHKLELKLQVVLTNVMRKALNDVEERVRVYARRCIPVLQTDEELNKVKRSISTSERHVRRNFAEGQKEVFDRKLARNHRHRDALKACFLDIIENLNLPASSLLDVLHEQHVLSISDLDSVRGGASLKQQNQEFLQIICGKLTLEEFNSFFLPTLQKDHSHLCEKIVEEMDKLDEQDLTCIACRVRSDVQVKRLAAPLFKSKTVSLSLYADLTGAGLFNSAKWAELEKQGVPHQAIIESLEKKYPDFYKEFKDCERTTLECFCSPNRPSQEDGVLAGNRGVAADSVVGFGDDPVYEQLSTASLSGDMEERIDLLYSLGNISTMKGDISPLEYPMKPTGRGICLIINNITFSRTKLRQRDGSEKDGDRLEKTFTKLGFIVHAEKNQNADQIKTLLNEYSQNTNHNQFDAFVCCLLSHGTNDLFYGTDGKPVSVSEITSQFTAFKCPSLAGKPKLFFIQADRGRNRMAGFNISSTDTATGSSAEDCQEVVAEEADFLIGYCTPPGYASYRSRSKGSWYIKALCDVLDQHAENNDILSCLLMVNDQIATANAKLDGGAVRREKQVPAPVFTLRKKVYLTVDPSVVPDIA